METSKRVGRIRLVIVVLVVLNLIAIGSWLYLRPRPNKNALAIGANATITRPVDIAIVPPVELDYQSRRDVLAMRSEAVYHYPELIQGDYRPSDHVFRQIKNGLPWWGMAGQFYYGSGDQSIDGPSEESRFIMNPYLLVGAELFGLTFWLPGDLEWDDDRITESDLNSPDFPLTCDPALLQWWPEDARIEVTYQVSACIQRLNEWTVRPVDNTDIGFSLYAYNARDFNMNYIYVSYGDSVHISKPDMPDYAIGIPHYIHQGGSCGYPGGCNNMSPYVPELDDLFINQLPAQVIVRLWEHEPGSTSETPDMVVALHFE
jgi:hypothetical protein